MKQRKQAVSVLLTAALLMGSVPMSVQAAPDETATGMQFYVSPNGSDQGNGTIDSPLASLEEARDRIRELKSTSGLPDGGVTVNLLAGEYPMAADSFLLDAQDSGEEGKPIVYQAAPGATVDFVGSLQASGSDFELVTDEAILNRLPEGTRDKVLVYDMTENLGISEFPAIQKNGFGWLAQTPSMSITVDGEPQTLSRYPNEGYMNIDNIHDKGFVNRNHLALVDGTCPECTKENGGTAIPCKMSMEERMSKPGGVWTTNGLGDKYELWSQENDIWTFGYFCWAYAEDNCHIAKVEQDGSGLKLSADQPSHYGVGGGNVKKYYAYNLLCEIDQPGEWYLDRESGKLYLYPEKDISASTVDISIMSNPFVKMENVEYVQFKNLDFSNSNGHGIEMLDCNHTLVAGCDFTDLGQLAVKVGEQYEEGAKFVTVNEGAHGGHDNVIQSCNILRTGQGGVYLAGGNRYTLTPSNNKVVNCNFNDYAVIKRTYCPAVWLYGCGSIVENNVIGNAPHMAIQIDGNNHVIKDNEIYNVCYETSDSGAIYTGRTWSFRGTVIENNYIHDMKSNSGVGSAAIYVDDMGCGVIAKDNLFVNLDGRAMLYGGGRDNIMTNNIYMNCGTGISYDNRSNGWAKGAVTAPNGQCYAEWTQLKNDPKLDKKVWAEQYPKLVNMDLTLDGNNVCIEGTKPAGAKIKDNIYVGVGNPVGSVHGAVKSNGEVTANHEYKAGTDIGFVSPDTLNYEVKEDSIIKEKLGDEHFKASEMGLYTDEYRTSVGTEVKAPGLLEPEQNAEEVDIASGVTFSWNPVEQAGTYLLEVATDSGFKDIVASKSTSKRRLISQIWILRRPITGELLLMNSGWAAATL